MLTSYVFAHAQRPPGLILRSRVSDPGRNRFGSGFDLHLGADTPRQPYFDLDVGHSSAVSGLTLIRT